MRLVPFGPLSLTLILLAACVSETGGPAPTREPPRIGAPPTASDYVAGPYSTRGRIVATTDVRKLGCPQCAPVPRILAAVDLNRDGTSELVLTHESFKPGFSEALDVPTRMTIVSGSGANYRGVSSLPSRVHPREAVVGDFNGDGVDDLFVAAQGKDGRPFPGEQNVLLLSERAGRHTDVSMTHIPVASDMAHGAGAGDIDGDGDLDLLVITNAGGGRSRLDNYFLINDGTGRFTRSPGRNHLPSFATQSDRFTTARLEDVTRDGHVDLLMAGSADTRQASVLLVGDGAGNFRMSQTLPRSAFGSDVWTTDIDVIDLDRDGFRDIVQLHSGRQNGKKFKGMYVQILMNEGGLFVDRTDQRMWGQNWASGREVLIPHNLTFADLNGDGAPDFVIQSLNPVWAEQPGDVPPQIGLNDGTGRFRPVTPRWLDPSQGYLARQLLPYRSGGRWVLAAHSLNGQNTSAGFISYGQHLTLYR